MSASATGSPRASAVTQRVGCRDARRRHHRRRPQRPRLRRLSRRRRAVGVRARAPRRPRRRRGHRGIPSRLSQLDGELHGEPARSAGDPRPAARRARPARSSSGRSRISCRCPDGDYLKVGGGLAATQAEVARFSRARRRARCPPTTRCSIASPTCCATCCSQTPPNVGGGARHDCRRRWSTCGDARLSRAVARRAPRRARSLHQERRRRARPLVRVASRSRRRSASTRSSAISRARTRRAPRTCCCITSSAR